ncbi:prolyl oligopeptidase family serine peptidase [Rhizobium sp. BK376]|uniref:alpha/beta hydrolase family protein n=1 Tax=Rhizobium sp. BK376 TaxID=2512149 RepID=UPI00104AD387|nr:prolyl oligopeptidase family serine peptidase [Rhizobium sp. BK376]TCR66934.1 prolyl oligopeptidase family protein [Rhizobium sp. BK376]
MRFQFKHPVSFIVSLLFLASPAAFAAPVGQNLPGIDRSQMAQILMATEKASDNAAAAVYPSSMLSSTWVTGNAAGEPYVYMTTGKPNKIILYLHSWTADMTQIETPFASDLLNIQNAIFVAPNFNGPNNTPAALGSQDTSDRINTVIEEIRYKTNLTRVYLVGTSGGGMASLLLLGRYPNLVYRASIWSPCYDLATAYGETADPSLKADMIAAIGSAPTGPDDPRYLGRSPRSVLQNFNGSTTKVIINVGTKDTTFPKHNGYDAMNAMLAASPGADVSVVEWPMGHEFHAIDVLKQLVLE